ncbi:hypothetical protein QO016_001245 [Methylobacterium persicinum]|uniref:Uncharacterized protein n=1 Tax=Methylobacterium persicinum TaxID=374426 RepID=A0ABU0HIJ0_9HYPH|nr:hypothetical protein [Methylobacterium persicinum]GJE39816.1 hypothetical protein KHHGKMAE_3902 [Methylobacterium persicinum]
MFRSFVCAATVVGLGLVSAEARPLRSSAEERPVVQDASPVRPVAAVISEGQPVCTHTRRRLWLEGEGWVVRKIATCR